MTYTLTAHPNTIIRDSDQAFIPTDPDNTDYAEYLAWLDEGNEPTLYTPPPAAKAKEQNSHGRDCHTSLWLDEAGHRRGCVELAMSSMRPSTLSMPSHSAIRPTKATICRWLEGL